ncbi:hypothetical protein FHX42_002671 [Saccharopolyspora lacisalsi]|uniref:SseB protein N-terminal domain-containing protein n=1 Tax=Halosaccharopolyspora lacisalsi TaxID=1000566 RepID=A0A839DWR3_9PSEU|nr:SAV_915 family protein [Halosaccharopolyspora lacisalsi]MBA8825320.1 hypothetical protein [Halosaccharopolyspora lacisalsi]
MVDPDETEYLPGQVYLAARPDESTGGLMLEIREADQQLVVLAYSSLERFVEGCGPDQPWILIPTTRLTELATEKAGGGGRLPSFRFGVMLDESLPPELRGTAGGWADEEAHWDEDESEESEDWAIVHLAAQPFRDGDEQANLELQPMPGDRLAVMAYTSTAAVEAGCGPQQASVPVPAGLLSEVRQQAGAHTICLDTPLPPHLRHGTNEGNWNDD